MAIRRNGAAVVQLGTLFNLGPTGHLTDGQLLERFATKPDEAAELAFAALVERHGPLVLRVCRSVLRDEHAAHDAFQATFLVLVDKGRSLWVRDSLAPWLHAVAYRVALCARGASARRRRHERARAGLESGQIVEDAPEAGEIGSVIHEEIEALPERYRVPIVLCDLEGRSHDEAARHLGWPVGTVKSRQARGRDRLRARLERRGVAPSTGMGLMVAKGAEAGSVSPYLANATVAVASRITAKGLGAAPAPVASLAKEALMGILIGKLKWAGMVLLGLALVATGALALASGGISGRRPAPRMLKTVIVPVEVPRDPVDKIYFTQEDGLVAVDPRTGVIAKIPIPCKNHPRISPDGRLAAYERDDAVWVRELEKPVEPRKLLDLDGASFGSPTVWSHDGSKLIVSLGKKDEAVAKGKNDWRFKTVRINVDGKGREELKVPDQDVVQDWSPDGWLVAASSRNANAFWQLYVMKPDGSGQRQITEGGNPFHARFSPDGKRLLYTDMGSAERLGIWVVGLDGKDRRRVLAVARVRTPSACWSPDGKRIAAIVVDKRQGGGVPPIARLVLQEVDGDGRTEFPLDGMDLNDMERNEMPDWR